MEYFYNYLIAPLIEYSFMQKSTIALLVLCLSAPVIGVFLTVRRMSLSGDAISHAILPGAAIGFLLGGLSVSSMTLGGIIAGIIVVILSSLLSNISKSAEDTVLTVFYLLSLALGVIIISIAGSSVDLLHFLFGSILSISNDTLIMLSIISVVNIFILLLCLRPLIIDCVEPSYLQSISNSSKIVQPLFMITTVLNLVASFQAIGTLMGVGLMMIPAASAFFWSNKLLNIIIFSIIIAIVGSVLGLVVSFNFNIPTSATIIIMLCFWYIFSLFFGVKNGVIFQKLKAL